MYVQLEDNTTNRTAVSWEQTFLLWRSWPDSKAQILQFFIWPDQLIDWNCGTGKVNLLSDRSSSRPILLIVYVNWNRAMNTDDQSGQTDFELLMTSPFRRGKVEMMHDIITVSVHSSQGSNSWPCNCRRCWSVVQRWRSSYQSRTWLHRWALLSTIHSLFTSNCMFTVLMTHYWSETSPWSRDWKGR